MDFGKELDGAARPVMVEAAYLCGRMLGHALTEENFIRQLESDVKTRHREQSIKIVLRLVSAIERVEGVSVSEMSKDKRAAYALELNDALWERIETHADDAQVESALVDLGASG